MGKGKPNAEDLKPNTLVKWGSEWGYFCLALGDCKYWNPVPDDEGEQRGTWCTGATNWVDEIEFIPFPINFFLGADDEVSK